MGFKFEATKDAAVGSATPVAVAKYIQLGYIQKTRYKQFPCLVSTIRTFLHGCMPRDYIVKGEGVCAQSLSLPA